MDKELKQKLDKIRKLKRLGRGTKGYSYSVEFSKNSDGFITVTSD